MLSYVFSTCFYVDVFRCIFTCDFYFFFILPNEIASAYGLNDQMTAGRVPKAEYPIFLKFFFKVCRSFFFKKAVR